MANDTVDRIYFIDKFKFTVNAVEYAVMELQITMQLSGIPTVVLTINPQPTPNPDSVTTAGIEDFAYWMGLLQSQVNTPTGIASLNFTVNSSDGVDSQPVSLIDWPITQVGFGNISAIGGFNTYVVLQHPIYTSTTAILSMINTYKAASQIEQITLSDIVSMLLESMDLYLKQKNPATADNAGAEGPSIGGDLTIEELDIIAHGKAVEALKQLREHIEWDPLYTGNKTPFAAVSADFLDHLITGGGLSMDTYLFDRNSPYDTLMSILDQMMLVTYWTNGNIKVGPLEPWAAPASVIYVDEVSTIDLPVYAINPISAVAVLGEKSDADYLNTAEGKVTNDGKILGSNTVIYGGYFKLAAVLEGYVRVINTPDWIVDYGLGASVAKALAENDINGSDVETTGAMTAAMDKARIALTDDLNSILNAYCEDEFWSKYRVDNVVSMGLRLLISEGGVAILRPGKVLELRSVDETPILACYITQVVHTISVQSARAYTSITGNRVRGSEGIAGVYAWNEDRKSKIYAAGAPAAAS